MANMATIPGKKGPHAKQNESSHIDLYHLMASCANYTQFPTAAPRNKSIAIIPPRKDTPIKRRRVSRWISITTAPPLYAAFCI